MTPRAKRRDETVGDTHLDGDEFGTTLKAAQTP